MLNIENVKSSIAELSLRRVFVALSGGVDSIVLLDLASKIEGLEVIALHVNHGISHNSDQWSSFCRSVCNKKGILIRDVELNIGKVKNLEAVARELRYDFFAQCMSDDDVLLMAHHLDDQAETFLLRMLRGSGVDGLSCIPVNRDLKSGSLFRPLLSYSKLDLINYAVANNLSWVEDESNDCSDYDRNFIRNEVMPLLSSRWCSASKNIAQSASLCSGTSMALSGMVSKLYGHLYTDNYKCLRLDSEITELSSEERVLVVRDWLKVNDILPISKTKLEKVSNFIVSGYAPYSQFTVELGDKVSIRYYNNKLWIVVTNNKLGFVSLDGTCIENIESFEVRKRKDGDRALFRGKVRRLSRIYKELSTPPWARDEVLIDETNSIIGLQPW